MLKPLSSCCFSCWSTLISMNQFRCGFLCDFQLVEGFVCRLRSSSGFWPRNYFRYVYPLRVSVTCIRYVSSARIKVHRKYIPINGPYPQMAHNMDHPHRPSSTPPILPYFTFHIPPHPLKTQNHVLEPSTSTIPPKRQLFQNGLKITPSIPKFTILPLKSHL